MFLQLIHYFENYLTIRQVEAYFHTLICKLKESSVDE